MKITVGTRGSKLALIQTNMVIDALKKVHVGLEVDIKIIKTTGDRILDKELSKIGGKGLFIKEIEEALGNKEIDFAVHSTKDLPHTLPPEFEIAAIPQREDPRDVLLFRSNYNLITLPAKAKAGTSSLRRMIQLKNFRPDLEFLPIRGNVDTRIKKLLKGEFDTIVLAAAGLKRMGWHENNVFFKSLLGENANITVNYLNPDDYVPAVGQGALAVEVRKNDRKIYDIIRVLNHEIDERCVLAERAFLKEVDGGCEIPIGAYCKAKGSEITIDGFIGDEVNMKLYRKKVSGNIDEYEALGTKLAKALLLIKNKEVK